MAHQQQRYKPLERIAAGGMAEVFRAESAGLEGFKKIVAIKRVLPHLSEKKQFIGMFLDEARVSAKLNHSNCVQVFDIGNNDNTYFIVMEFVDGSDLKAVIEHRRQFGQPIPVQESVLICVRICEGLSYAHELVDSNGKPLNIIHRDMSPPNVLITRFGEVKIADFGLAKATSQLEQSEPGIIKGKFGYLSPEAAKGMPIDQRTDIFAIGIMLWEMLAGRRLFLGETDLATVRQVQNAEIPPLRQFNPHVTPELEAVLLKALAGDPTKRYQSARDLGRDLNSWLFRSARAVSSFDIAALVDPIRAEREAKRRIRGADRGSVIGSMIDEALFEFTSVEASDGGDSPAKGSAPLQIGAFENAQDWADDLGDLGGGSLSRSANSTGERGLELGNLAALEDDAPRARRAQFNSEAPTGAGLASVVEGRDSDRPEANTKSKKGLGLGKIVVVLVLLALAGTVGAYFAGALPPQVNSKLHQLFAR
jgi:serine/threonine protein kinase